MIVPPAASLHAVAPLASPVRSTPRQSATPAPPPPQSRSGAALTIFTDGADDAMGLCRLSADLNAGTGALHRCIGARRAARSSRH